MRIHVELGKRIVQNKQSKIFTVWLSARHLFPCGHFIPSKENIERIGSLINRKERAVRRLIALGYKEDLFRGKDCKGRLYIESYDKILDRLGVKSKACFDLELEHLPNLQEKLFSVYLENLIRWRRHNGKQGNQGNIFWRRSYSQGEQLSLILRRGFDPAMLSVSYIGKIFKLSNTAIFKLKARCKDLKYLKSSRRLIPLIDFDRKELRGLHENQCSERFIVIRKGRYCFNATSFIEFYKKTRFFKPKDFLKRTR